MPTKNKKSTKQKARVPVTDAGKTVHVVIEARQILDELSESLSSQLKAEELLSSAEKKLPMCLTEKERSALSAAFDQLYDDMYKLASRSSTCGSKFRVLQVSAVDWKKLSAVKKQLKKDLSSEDYAELVRQAADGEL